MRYRKKNYVYSIQISKEQSKLLKKSADIKIDLDKYVREYLDSFFNENDELNNKK